MFDRYTETSSCYTLPRMLCTFLLCAVAVFWRRIGSADTPAASAADALVSPSAEGLVVMLGGECASVSPARGAFAV